jgi:hypothetical protein
MTPSDKYKKIISDKLIKNLEKRNMEGYYAPTKEKAVETVLSLISDGSSVSWGGSVSMSDLKLNDELKKCNYTLLDRSTCKTPEETKEMYHKALNADYYIMSSNAITKDGVLINIDGNGNRVAALIYGPENVIVVVGMNKITPDVETGYKRIKNIACPLNTLRLSKNTPCAKTGECSNCLSSDCICNQIVVTRRSGIKGRIKVIIVGENLGY